MFRGSFTALITPYINGGIDWNAFDNLVEWQLDQGTHGFVVCGTTGESPALSAAERTSLIKRCVEISNGRAPVLAGTGTNATMKTIDMTEHARSLNVDAAMIVTPYYNKPTQEGLYQHYKTIAESVDIPIMIYNIPGRCIVDMNVETMARLAKIPNIIGVKDATADKHRVQATKDAIGEDFCQLSGEDHLIHEFLAAGGHGCVSVTANIAPALCAALHNHWIAGDHDTARAVQDRLMPLHKALFTETSPQPAKYAAQRLGLCRDEMRLPLVPASAAARAAIDDALAVTGLLSDANDPILQAHG